MSATHPGLLGLLLAILALGLLALTCLALSRLHEARWLGMPPTAREHLGAWRGVPTLRMAALVVAREITHQQARTTPRTGQWSRGEVWALMAHTTTTQQAYLRSARFADLGVPLAVVTRWTRRYGLASLETHLVAGYTGAEMQRFLTTGTLPTAEATRMMAAMRTRPDADRPATHHADFFDTMAARVADAGTASEEMTAAQWLTALGAGGVMGTGIPR